MHKITRNVRDLERDERQVYESVLGERLRENQVVILQVVNLAESAAVKRASEQAAGTLPEWCNVYDGLSAEEIAEVERVALERADLTRPS